MRKDVKIGLAIGGVLLAVLIVYLLVPKDAGQSTEYGRGDGPSTTSEENPGITGSSESGSGGATDGAYRPEAGSSNQTTTSGGQSDPPPGVADTSTRNDDAGVSTGEARPDPASRPFNWNEMLSYGVMPDKTLMAVPPQTDSRQTTGAQATGVPGQTPVDDPFATQPNTPGGRGEEPNWNAGATGSSGTAAAPTRPQSPAQPAGGVREHTVQPGETLSSIAIAVYGESRYYLAIERANPNLDPKRMRPGTVIKLPDVSVVKAEAKANAAARQAPAQQQGAVDPAREYRVQPGDSLYKISMRLYGRGDKADELYAANRDRIGDDSARLKVGTVIKLPEPPTASPTATR